MGFGIIIIGDEVLTGRRRDAHFNQSIQILAQRGWQLAWSKIIGDEPSLITNTLRQSMASDDVVFCFGGIGATPDDHTRYAAAQAAGKKLLRHPEAVAEIEARFGPAAYPKRVLMADLPETSTIIPNPYNRIPGFSLGAHHFLPGFPIMAWPMMEYILDTRYMHLRPAESPIEKLLVVLNASEGDLLEVMIEFVEKFPQIKFSCLPEIGDQRKLEFGIRGNSAIVDSAFIYLQELVETLGYECRSKSSINN